MRILVVEDNSRMAELLRQGLTSEGHTVDVALDGLRGLEKAQQLTFDAMVLDVMLPGLDGMSLARRLRASGSRVPILMLTARDSASDIVRGLDNGADDYLTKPFSFEVLVARLRAMTRRNAAPVRTNVFEVADLVLDAETHEVRRAGRLVVLTPTEYLLLQHLIRRAGRVASREELIEALWGGEKEIESNTLDVFIFQLRSKLELNRASRLVQTVRGFGYAVREAATAEDRV